MSNNHNDNERRIVIGGTFDALHKGHKEYIRMAFEISKNALIYVSSDGFANKNKKYKILPYEFRKQRIQQFIDELCEQLGKKIEYSIRPLPSRRHLGKDLSNKNDDGSKITHALVTSEYYDLFLEFNRLRKKRKLKEIRIVTKPRSRTSDNMDISSSNIRQGYVHDRACNYWIFNSKNNWRPSLAG